MLHEGWYAIKQSNCLKNALNHLQSNLGLILVDLQIKRNTDLKRTIPVGLGKWIPRLHLYIPPVWPPSQVVPYMTLNDLMARHQYFWCFGECRVHLQCHCLQVHSGPEHLIGSYLSVKWHMLNWIVLNRTVWSFNCM